MIIFANSKREVGECLVGVCHAVDIGAFFDRVAFVFGGEQEFVRELLGDRLAFARARRGQYPVGCQKELALAAYLSRYLIRSSTDAARFHLQERAHVADSRIKIFSGSWPCFFSIKS